MSIVIDGKSSKLPGGNLLAGNPVMSDEWTRMARMINWIEGGRVSTLVPPSAIMSSDIVTSDTYRFYVKPRFNAVTRLWMVYIDTSTNARGTYYPDSDTARNYVVEFDTPEGKVYWYEQHVSQSSSATEVTFTVTRTSGVPYVQWIACYELPRVVADPPSSERFIHTPSVKPGEPIHNDAGDTSIVGIYDNQRSLITGTNRAQWGWSADDNDSSLVKSTTSATFVDLAVELGPIMLGRLRYNSDTVYTVHIRVRGKGDGQVRFTMDSGDTVTLNNNFGGSFAWSSELDIDVDAENLSSADGRRSSRWDHCAIEFLANSGTFEVSAITVYDAGGE